ANNMCEPKKGILKGLIADRVA
ncbi:hypothetical protein CCACVL1_00821, partial [Corchorus capsularis]